MSGDAPDSPRRAGALTLLAPACGNEPEPPHQEPLVRLESTTPADAAVARAESIEISGTVKPACTTVQVLGNEVAVDGGRFSAEVEPESGANPARWL